MSESPKAGIYLIVDFQWPHPFDPAIGVKARKLHDVVQGQSWIREIMAASGGVGAGPAYTWVFWLENYAALDRLLRNAEDEICKAYVDFFSQMEQVSDKLRGEVLFL
ncbi:MAG: hypothetical protein R3A44_40960 [Caldilineaceae bacterium]